MPAAWASSCGAAAVRFAGGLLQVSSTPAMMAASLSTSSFESLPAVTSAGATVWNEPCAIETAAQPCLNAAGARLGDVLAELRQPAAAARARGGRRDDHALARQMRRQRCADRLPAGEAPHHRAAGRLRGGFGGDLVRRGARLELLELQLQLVEQLAAFRGGTEALAPQLGDEQLQLRDHRLGARRASLRLPAFRPLG